VSLKNGQVFFHNDGVNSLNKGAGIVFQNMAWANKNGSHRLPMNSRICLFNTAAPA
jgi:hypothetical protein